MADIRTLGQTSNTVRMKLVHATTGAGLTGLTSASSGLFISTIANNEATATAYTVAGSNVETITMLGTFSAPTSNKCRFKEVDATNHPGLYELQFADARFAVSNARYLTITVGGATNLLQTDYLVEFDPDANLSRVLGTALTEDTTGLLAAAFKKFFNVGTPAGTVNCLPSFPLLAGTADAGSTTTLQIPAAIAPTVDVALKGQLLVMKFGSGDVFAKRIDSYNGSTGDITFSPALPAPVTNTTLFYVLPAAIAELNSNFAASANLKYINDQTATATSAVTFAGTIANTTNITGGTITTVTNLTNLPAITNNWLTAAGIASDAITAAKIADGAIDAATFASGALDGVWSTTTRTLTAGTNIVLAKGTGITGFNDPTAAAIADAVWDETASDHNTAGSTGNKLNSASAPTAAAVADAVWDETAADHNTAGSMGAKMNAAGAAADPWAVTIPGSYTAGTAGYKLGNISSFTFNGSRAVTITVNDGAAAIASALVRVTQGSSSELKQTNGSGVVTFSLDDGSYTLSITKGAAYTYTPETITVSSGATSFTKSMTAVSIPTPSTGQCTGTLTVVDTYGAPESGVTVYFEAYGTGESEGSAFTSAPVASTSGGNGVISRLFPSGEINYRYRRGTTGNWVPFTTSATDGGSFTIPSNVGKP